MEARNKVNYISVDYDGCLKKNKILIFLSIFFWSFLIFLIQHRLLLFIKTHTHSLALSLSHLYRHLHLHTYTTSFQSLGLSQL